MFEKLAKIIKKRYAEDEDEDEDEEKEEEEEEEEEVVDSDWFMEDLCIKDKRNVRVIMDGGIFIMMKLRII